MFSTQAMTSFPSNNVKESPTQIIYFSCATIWLSEIFLEIIFFFSKVFKRRLEMSPDFEPKIISLFSL
jgi:hypothetical protein